MLAYWMKLKGNLDPAYARGYNGGCSKQNFSFLSTLCLRIEKQKGKANEMKRICDITELKM